MKGDKLTIKQRKWMREYIKTGNAAEAAMRVYNCKNRESAAQIGWENLRKLDYVEFMEECGITDKRLQDVLEEGLKSTKVVSARVTSKEADSTTDDFIDVEDYPTRHKYLETALKLRRRLIERKDITTDNKELPMPILKVNIGEILRDDSDNQDQ